MEKHNKFRLEDEAHNGLYLTKEDISILKSFEYYPVMEYLKKVKSREFNFEYDKYVYDDMGRSLR